MASGLENIETIESPFRRFVTTIGVFPTAFTDAMTYYECLAYLVKYLEETVIPAVNENAEAVEELQRLYIQLKSYVDNYFENLDVQEEINNKLDEMFEDGVLQEIITQYVQTNVPWTFENVSDMQHATNLVNGSFALTLGFNAIGDGGGALYKITDTGTVDNLNTFAVGDLYATAVNDGIKKISLDELPLVSGGIYTLGKVTVDSAVQLPRQVNRNIVIVDTVFDINTSVFLPAYNDNSYFVLPSFVGCTFNNLTNGRVLITSGSNDTVASRFTHCYFNDVDMIANSGYVQDFNFTSCYIASHQTFIDCPTTTAQVRMVNCSVESESKQLIKCLRLIGYFSGTYEGNISQDFHFIDATQGVITIDNAWLESVKFLHLTGGSSVHELSTINVLNSNLNGYTDSTPQLYVDSGTWVQFYTAGTRWTSYNQGSRFCNLTPSQFNKCTGSFAYTQDKSYVQEMGGENLYDYAVATEKYVTDIENKHFIHQECKLLANTQYDISNLPCGTYFMIIGRGAYGAVNYMHEYVISVSKTQNYAYATKILGTTDSQLDNTTVSASKASGSDTTFTLSFSSPTAFTAELNMIRIS